MGIENHARWVHYFAVIVLPPSPVAPKVSGRFELNILHHNILNPGLNIFKGRWVSIFCSEKPVINENQIKCIMRGKEGVASKHLVAEAEKNIFYCHNHSCSNFLTIKNR